MTFQIYHAGHQNNVLCQCRRSAEGVVLPPFYVYPEPKPTAYDSLLGSTRRSVIHYKPKEWMDSNALSAFIDHFHNNVDKNDRPVVLLIDSVC